MTRRRVNPLQKLRRNIISTGKPDTILLGLVAMLCIFGLIMVFDASAVIASAEPFNDQFRFLKLQSFWLVLGITGAVFTYYFNYKNYPKLVIPALVVTIILLFSVFFVGQLWGGSKRWFDFGVVRFQPSELAKLVFTVYLACWLSRQKKSGKNLKDSLSIHLKTELLPFLIIFSIVCILILIEPDLGTTMIVASTALAVYFLSGTDVIHTIGSILIIMSSGLMAFLAAIIEKYRFSRLQTFLETLRTGNVPNPWREGYQLFQVLIAVGSGGFLGVGFGESKQKFHYLVGSAAFTDNIFAVFAEEFGFIGCLILVSLFLVLVIRGFLIATKSKDRLGMLLASGITFWIGIQAFLHIAANIGLAPLTGVPLPFISYGGSSMVVIMIGLGILLNISKSEGKRS